MTPIASPSDRQRRSSKRLLSLPQAAAVIVMAALPPGVHAGYHDQGHLSMSLGGSMSHDTVRDRKTTYVATVTGDQYIPATTTSSEDYEDVNVMLSLSTGYFFVNHCELGVSGSLMDTWYHGGDRQDFEILDAMLYARYFFDGASSLTPYLKTQAGISHLKNGTYTENDTKIGGVAGLEFLGMGSMTWYAELSSQYTFDGGSLSGTEWRNQIYIGISWYFDLQKKKAKILPAAPAGDTALPLEKKAEAAGAATDLHRQIPCPAAQPAADAAAQDARKATEAQLIERVRDADARWQDALRRADHIIESKTGATPPR